ncbi:MAG: glycosyltransferase [Clostridium sp.]|nr:glycosyltransferase [Prevotella sp.]MCM1429131.1 glycosyltransferase [Clostridium sp.]MCM1475341.1 glycosyltransferase [Muribaculaceae bacterium]
MKVVLVNKSDTTGGAAVVGMRLMRALRDAGIDARMIVADKLSDSPYVDTAAGKLTLRRSFLAERLKIFLANGLDRATLFQIDTASDGVDIANHPWVRRADIVCLNWVNQGLLSLKGLEKLISTGKKIVWTMHDMWNFTGICHHAGGCRRFIEKCGECPLLKQRTSIHDLSYRTHKRKANAYGKNNIHFVAVSNWLARLARESSLLQHQDVRVIPNVFPLKEYQPRNTRENKTLIFGAARLDDPVKGLDYLREATNILAEKSRQGGPHFNLVTFGGVKDTSNLSGFGIPVKHMGTIRDAGRIERLYRQADIVVSSSLYETLPGTLVEGQAYGCIPVSFDRGGQSDIINHLKTGYIAPLRETDTITQSATGLAEGILWAAGQGEECRLAMYNSVEEKFSSTAVAGAYIRLFKSLLK